MTRPADELAASRPNGTSITFTVGSGYWRGFFKWAAGILLVFVLGLLLVSLTAMQLTAEGTAHKVLRRTIASLTEIDGYLAGAQQEFVSNGGAGETDAEPSLTGYPVDIPLSAAEASLPEAELRDLVLDRSADEVYAEGFSAFKQIGLESTDIEILSPPGAVRYSAGMLTADNHQIMRVTTFVLAGAALVLALLLVALSRGYGRLTGLGVAVLVASLPFLVVAMGARFVLRLVSEEENDYLTAQLFALGRDVTWLPIRHGIVFAAMGAVFLVMGVTFSLLSPKRPPSLR